MKKTIALLLLTALLSLSLCSCVDRTAEKEFISSFLAEIEKGDFEAASEYLHPERPADLTTYFENIEAEQQIDFQSGIEFERYSGFKSAMYDSTVGGSTYSTTAKVTVDGKSLEIEIELVENSAGYGIYNLDIHY